MGGKNLINLTQKPYALKLQWAKRLFNEKNNGAYKRLMTHYLNSYRNANQGKYTLLTFIEATGTAKLPPFYRDFVKGWWSLTENSRPKPDTLQGIMNEPLHLNLFLRDKKTRENPFPKLPNPREKHKQNQIVTIGDICKQVCPGFLSHRH